MPDQTTHKPVGRFSKENPPGFDDLPAAVPVSLAALYWNKSESSVREGIRTGDITILPGPGEIRIARNTLAAMVGELPAKQEPDCGVWLRLARIGLEGVANTARLMLDELERT